MKGKPEGGTGRELVVACRGADGALSTRVNVRESDSWSDVRSAIEKSLRTSHNRGIQKIFFQDLTGNLISLDSESSWTLCKSLQSLKEQRHISLVIKDQDKPSALRHPLTASRPDDALSAHVPSGDFLHAQAHGAVVLKDEIRNHSSYDAPTRSNSDPGRARLLKLKPPPLKSKEARSSAVMREHGEHFVSSSTLSLKNMKISNLKEYDVTLPERGSCFKNIMYRSKLEEDASYDIALLEQLGSEGPVHVDLKPSHAVLQAGASCKIALRFTRNAGAANDAAKTNLPNILVGVKAQHSDYFDVLKLRFTAP
uniref:PB1 domain-containing protein n=1 Tax=Guillardia theta TaxID=55529 RepID=A0A7S4NLG2_GUITH|mmetsp:Transcript_24255/g.79052  ORF Transcript_24255/g.79052 Transcript_24255/m.79052 type:complete len:311 (+) Transcript_24255:440-1372(+)